MSNFYDQIALAASRYSGRPAIEMVRDTGLETLTYASLIDLSAQFAGWLHDTAQVEPGDRIAILAANDPRWVAAYLGVLRSGCVAVPLDTAYRADQIRTLLTDSGARVLFVSDRLDATARAALTTDRPHQIRLAALSAPLEGSAVARPVVHRTPDDAAVILYTSGTTADPKGVVLTHGNLEAERTSALAIVQVTEQDVVLGVLPLFHALAQMANLLLPLAVGARVVFLDAVNSTTLLEALQTRGISIFACVPQFFYLIHQRVMGEIAKRGAVGRRAVRLLVGVTIWLRNHTGLNPGPRLFGRVHRAFGPRMRMLITGGSRFDPHIARDLYGMGLTLLNGYGLTETSGAATLVRPGDAFTTSVGQPLPGVEVRIEPDAAASADGAMVDGSGEILIRGPVVMREYFGRPDATAEVFDDGWLRTGDLGHVDAQGRVYITGRKKEVIVLSSGKNLYPEEIEAHYRQAASIKELCVLGLSEPGAPAAERLHALVVVDDEALRARSVVNVRELVRFEIEGLSVQLPAHKRILSYDISADPLPRTTTGKLRRGELERRQRSQAVTLDSVRALSNEEQTWTDAPEHGHLVAAVRERLNRSTVRPDDNLELDLHLDSMERVELLTRLEYLEHTRVSPDVRARIFTVRQLVEAVRAAPAADMATAPSPGSEGRPEWETLLAARPDPTVVGDLSRPAFARALAFYLTIRAAALVTHVLFHVEVRGRHLLPKQGPYVITPNHQSYLDGFLLASALPLGVLRQIFFVGASEYFETPLMRWLARAANIVPVDPDANLVTAMQTAATGLRLGKVLILFPEGERSIDGRLRPFRKGAAILAQHLEVPVVPVALDGLFDVWPRGRGFNWRLLTPWRRHRLSVSFAPSLRLERSSYAESTDVIRTAVAEARWSAGASAQAVDP